MQRHGFSKNSVNPMIPTVTPLTLHTSISYFQLLILIRMKSSVPQGSSSRCEGCSYRLETDVHSYNVKRGTPIAIMKKSKNPQGNILYLLWRWCCCVHEFQILCAQTQAQVNQGKTTKYIYSTTVFESVSGVIQFTNVLSQVYFYPATFI